MTGLVPWIPEPYWWDCFVGYGIGGYAWHGRAWKHFNLEQRAKQAMFVRE